MRNAHEGQVTTGTHAAERLIERRLVAHRLDDAVGTQAVGQFLDACDALLAALSEGDVAGLVHDDGAHVSPRDE